MAEYTISKIVDINGNELSLKDGSLSDWARATSKPEYTASEVGALPDTTTIPNITYGTTLPDTLADGAIFLLYEG